MVPVGYMYKNVALKPDWLMAEDVVDIYSLSSCVSEDFADYINYWKHNGYWLFNSPLTIEEIAQEHNIDISGATIFYYEVYGQEFDADTESWSNFATEPSFLTDVEIPEKKILEGFDVTTFTVHTSPECSPLSCNSLAATIAVNEHCLFRTFTEAKDALENGYFTDSEPGPFRIFSVYTVKAFEQAT
ncbi:MAG: hypothetical protein V4812_18535 [Pseudomonadota bacterium]